MVTRVVRKVAKGVLRRMSGTRGFSPFVDMRRLLQRESIEVVFDVGGHYGVVARKFAEIFPAAVIFSFEPHPESFATLKKNVAGNGRIIPVNVGAYSESATLALHLNAVPGSSSLLPRPRKGRAYHNPTAIHRATADVPLVRLDRWVKSAGIDRVDLLKLDVQGSELQALKGCGDLLRNAKAIYSEVQFYPVYDGACLFDEVWSFLRQFEFSLFQLYAVWGGEDGQIVQGDALFISEQVRRSALTEGRVRSIPYFNWPEQE